MSRNPISDVELVRLALVMIRSRLSKDFIPDATFITKLQDLLKRLGIDSMAESKIHRHGDTLVYLWHEDSRKAAIIVHDSNGRILFLPDALAIQRGGVRCGTVEELVAIVDEVLTRLPAPDTSET